MTVSVLYSDPSSNPSPEPRPMAISLTTGGHPAATPRTAAGGHGSGGRRARKDALAPELAQRTNDPSLRGVHLNTPDSFCL